MLNWEKPELELVRAEWPEGMASNVKGLFTCRTGGVSSGPWGGPEGIMGLNVGPHVGDVESCVKMNRMIVGQLVPSSPKWLSQVHGATVLHADDVQGAPEADATWTTTPGVVCAVMTADCLPVFLADRKGRGVAAVHAGWRSLAAGILPKATEALRTAIGTDAQLVAWFGPRIGAEAFETGADVLEAMRERLPEADRAFKATSDGRYLADLAELARQSLAQAQITDIVDCGLSTAADANRFWSYRRDGARSGRHAALVWFE